MKSTFENEWSVKHPQANISKDDIRKIVGKVFEKYDYYNRSGTVIHGESITKEKYTLIPFTIDNVNNTLITEEIMTDLLNEFKNCSGKEVSLEGSYLKQKSFQDEKMNYPALYKIKVYIAKFN
jgi:hypothetical protein